MCEHQPSNPVVTCVYCGHQYPDGTPTHQAELLTAHIKVCEKHPMRQAEAHIADLSARLARIHAFTSKCVTRYGEPTSTARKLVNLCRGYDEFGNPIPKDCA